MIQWIKRRVFKSKTNERYTDGELAKLKSIWNSLDPDLKKCAKISFEFGKFTHSRNLTLNEVGMSQLIQHLAAHGFEIKKISNDTQSPSTLH